MIITGLATILLFLIFTIIGFGPTLLLISSRKSFETSLAIAPVVGLIVTTLIGTYLILLDYPINAWAFPWLIIGVSCSLVMSFIAVKLKNISFGITKNIGLLFLLGLLITILLLLAPMILGGLDFTVLRGNGTDQFNYLSMAGYLIHEPYSWFHHVTTKVLLNKDPAYFLVPTLLNTRWSTTMLLGWCSTITHIPLYRIDYGFTTLFFMMAYCCTFWYATRMNIKPKLALLVAIAISAGFWGQFVLDLRAMSQISVLPLIILLAFLWDSDENSGHKDLWEYFLIAITFTAIIFLYVEILPLLALGILFYFAIQVFHKRFQLKSFIKYSLILGVTFFTTLPAFSSLERYFHIQMTWTLHNKITWENAYFPWLYSHPLRGFWGFAYLGGKLIPSHTLIGTIFAASMVLFSVLLTLVLFYLLIRLVYKPKKLTFAIPICSLALTLASFTLFIYLFLRDQFWAAGKGLSYGYPFWMLIIALALSNFWQIQHNSKFKQVLMLVGKYTVLLWFLLQCTLGIQRIAYAGHGRDYHNYILNHGDYRKHDWNFDEFSKFLTNAKASSVGIRVTDNWLTEYLGLVLGWNFHVVDMNGVRDQDGILLLKQDISFPPEYIITERDDAQQKQSQVLVKNKEFVLIRNSNE